MPEYRKMYERVRSWYEKGYIYKDVATTQDAGSQLVRSALYFPILLVVNMALKHLIQKTVVCQ